MKNYFENFYLKFFNLVFGVTLLFHSQELFGEIKSKHVGQLKFLNPSINFGTVEQGKKLKHRFYFKSEGKEPLRITKVETNCGCTILNSSLDKTYKFGEHGFLEFYFDTSKKIGSVHNIIIVHTNEKFISTRTLSILANVLVDYKVSRNTVNFGNIIRGTTVSEQVVLEPVNEFKLNVEEIKYNKKIFNVTYNKKNENYLINISFKAPHSLKQITDHITIVTNSKSQKDTHISIISNITGPIQTSPQRIEFGEIEKNSTSKRLVKLNSMKSFELNKSTQLIHINGVKYKGQNKLLKWTEIKGTSNEKTIELTLEHLAKSSGSIFGKLIFHTKDEKISVEFHAFFL